MFSTSSALTLAMICHDRYRAVVHPFKARRMTKTHIKHCIFAIHFTSCTFVIPYVVVLDLKGDQCDEHWPSPVTSYRKAYTLILFLVQYGIPLTVMVTLHSLALTALCGQSKQLREGSTYSNTSESIMQFRIAARKKMQNIHITKMFVTVVMVFALSMFPNQVLWLWVDFGNGGENEYFVIISAVCRLFTYSNSVLNAIIYGFYNRELRSGKAKLTSTTLAGRNPGIHSSGLRYAEHRSAHGVEKTVSVNRGLSDIIHKKTIHYNSHSTGEQRLLPKCLLGSIKNHPPLPLQEDCQPHEAAQGPMKPIENCTVAQDGFLQSPLNPLHNSESVEEMDHVVFMPDYTQTHFDNIRESNC